MPNDQRAEQIADGEGNGVSNLSPSPSAPRAGDEQPVSALTLTDEDWNLLAAICETWLDLATGGEPTEMFDLARRIVVANEAGQ